MNSLKNGSRLKFRKGLTLIEIAVVIAVMGTIMAIAISSLRGLIRPSAKDTASKFQSALYFCYKNAIVHNSAVVLKIDLDLNEYNAFRIIRTEEGMKEKKILSAKLPKHSRILSVQDIRGIRQETGIALIPFTHSGVSQDYNFYFGGDSGIEKTVMNYRYNGKVIVLNGEKQRHLEDSNSKNSLFENESNQN
jgi:prepilin-type N-terminal cleavage/methylation domain-containing protein